MTKKDVKEFWENNKKKILVGGAMVTTGLISLVLYKNRKNVLEYVKEIDLTSLWNGSTKPSRLIPETEGFKILDIADDVKDGCVVWLDGCKLKDCGKLGEGLSKIERVDPEMFVTMGILAKDIVEEL